MSIEEGHRRPDPRTIHDVVLTGHDLTLEQFVAVARLKAKVSISDEAMQAMTKCREMVERFTEEGKVIYGITTGFGGLSNKVVSPEEAAQLSTNLILSHAVGIGEPYSEEQVRGMMLLRANALCAGISGARPIIATMLVEMLNKGVIPVVPQKGSLGASGDLAPLSHMGLVLLGKGTATYRGRKWSGAEAMALAEIPVLDTLISKEGLAVTNGTCAMTSVGALNLYDAMEAVDLADIVAAVTFTALDGQLPAFDERVHMARPHPGQILAARNMRLLTAQSENLKDVQGERVQDAYALRCIPQAHGAVREALDYVRHAVEIELNAVTDNPLIFPDGTVISGGNFHGDPMAIPFDTLGIALTKLASISERRTERMVNPNLSNGLPAFLAPESGVNSGFMIVQYTAASVVSENKVLAHPASVDSIPSSANQEDYVSMGTTAARKAGEILENALSVLGCELWTACQALDLRCHGLWWPDSPVLAVYDLVRDGAGISAMEKDREMRIDMEKIQVLVRSGKIQRTVREMVPGFGHEA